MRWSPTRVFLIARNTFREAVRTKLFLAMMILALAAFFSSFLFKEFNFGSSELKLIADFGFGGMTLFGSILAIIASAQLFIGEIEHRTALTVLAKPLYRSEYVLGKFFGSWITVCIFIMMLGICLSVSLWMRETSILQGNPEAFRDGGSVSFPQVFAFAALQILRLGMLCALVAFFSSYATSSVFAMSMGFLVWIAAQLQHIATDAWAVAGNWLLKGAFALASLSLPNFSLFEIGDRIALGGSISALVYLKLGAYALLYTMFYLSIAIFAFNRREL